MVLRIVREVIVRCLGVIVATSRTQAANSSVDRGCRANGAALDLGNKLQVMGPRVMIQTSIALVSVNLALLLFLGFIRQENPFDLLVLAGLVVLNLICFVMAAIVTYDSPSDAVLGLLRNAAPVLVIVGTTVILVLVNVDFRSHE